jgi:hypothetical protein
MDMSKINQTGFFPTGPAACFHLPAARGRVANFFAECTNKEMLDDWKILEISFLIISGMGIIF